jgi:hypothetical protein
MIYGRMSGVGKARDRINTVVKASFCSHAIAHIFVGSISTLCIYIMMHCIGRVLRYFCGQGCLYLKEKYANCKAGCNNQHIFIVHITVQKIL